MNPKSKDEIKDDELLVLGEEHGHGFRRRLRVVSFVINGIPKAPTIEVRMFRDRDDNKYGRIVGMNFAEAKVLMENWDKVCELWLGK